MMQAPSDLDIEAALQHPKAFFAEPKDVVSHPTLSRDMKLAILQTRAPGRNGLLDTCRGWRG